MVCNRCIMAVESLFKDLGFTDYKVAMGTVSLDVEGLDKKTLDQIRDNLRKLGFELLDDKKSQLIEAIKNTVVKIIHQGNLADQKINWSDIIAKEVKQDYKYLSQLFSAVEGITLEHYIILQKIEKVKELIVYNELTISEITWKLGYSSVAHLSNQFHKVTGMRPKTFKLLGVPHRKPLDEV